MRYRRKPNQNPDFLLFAYETFDIFGVKQLSIGVRFFDSPKIIREDILDLVH